MGKIVMTGVDGNFGGHAARTIIDKIAPENLIFTVPNTKALEQYAAQGIETRHADFNTPEQLKGAFSGGEVLLLISMPFVGEKRRNAHKKNPDKAERNRVLQTVRNRRARAKRSGTEMETPLIAKMDALGKSPMAVITGPCCQKKLKGGGHD